jgi:hypothetical protein
MAAKDMDHGGDAHKLVGEVADLWFHSMIALAHYGLSPADVVAELTRREGLSGLEEKALRKAEQREKNITQKAENDKKIKDLQDRILLQIANASDDILEDTELKSSLEES